MQKYNRFQLENGLEVIAQHMPSFRSAAVGVWVRVGSVDESVQENGYSHFIEHLLFKGTQKRSAKALAMEMDALGGQVNAFTSKECTCFHAKVAGEQLPGALDMLSDLMLNARLDPDDVKKEKGVVLEEISMVEDSPEDVAHDLIAAANFGEEPLARTILGPAQNIAEATRDAIVSYKARFYTPENAVLAIAGSYGQDELEDLARQYFGSWQGGSAPARRESAPVSKQRLFRDKKIEQAHLCLGFDGVSQGSDELYAMTIFNSILGAGMSSRLFQKIREDKGLAYSVYSYPAAYAGVGMMNIYAGTSPKNVQAVADSIAKELRALLKKGVSREEFDRAKQQLKGSYILSQESTASRMNAIGRGALVLERVLTEDQVLEKIERVTIEDVAAVMEKVISSPMSAALIGDGCRVDYTKLEELR